MSVHTDFINALREALGKARLDHTEGRPDEDPSAWLPHFPVRTQATRYKSQTERRAILSVKSDRGTFVSGEE